MNDMRLEQHQSQERLPFNGMFNDAVRFLLRQKRLELGLTYERLANIFNVNWSTIRKWENGPTERCALFCRPLVNDFLDGKFDHIIRPRPAAASYAEQPSQVAASAIVSMGDTLKQHGMLDTITIALLDRFQKRLEEINH